MTMILLIAIGLSSVAYGQNKMSNQEKDVAKKEISAKIDEIIRGGKNLDIENRRPKGNGRI